MSTSAGRPTTVGVGGVGPRCFSKTPNLKRVGMTMTAKAPLTTRKKKRIQRRVQSVWKKVHQTTSG